MGGRKSSSKREVCLRKQEKSQINNLAYFIRKQKKKKQSPVSRRKEIVNIRVDISKLETKTIENVNEIKSWLFEKTNKIDKPVARCIKKRKKEGSNQLNQK